MTEMSPVSNRLSIRYLDNFSADKDNTNTSAPVAAPESFLNGPNIPALSHQKTHLHSKEKVDQNELSNDASNETSDSENVNSQNPLTSRNLEAQNHKNEYTSATHSKRPISSSTTSPATGEESGGKSNQSTDATEATSSGLNSSERNALPKKFFCKVCNQGFTRKHNMVSHEMIHTTIKLHRCKSCNLLFRRIHDLKRHEKLHTGEKPYHCENCDRSFARPDALTRHLNSPHACSGHAKEAEDHPHRNQTSNTSSSSYQASKLKEAMQVSERSDALSHATELTSVPRLVDGFNEEQLLPLGTVSSSDSILPTAKENGLSDQDSGAISSGAERPGLPNPIQGSTMGLYAPSSSFSADSNGSNTAPRPDFEINRWRSQQLHKGEQVSEDIVRGIIQKQGSGTDSTSTNSAPEEAKTTLEQLYVSKPSGSINFPPQQDPQSQQYYRQYSPYHRLSASMGNTAVLNKVAFQNQNTGRYSIPGPSSGPGSVKSSFSSILPSAKEPTSNQSSPQKPKDANIVLQAPPSYHTNRDMFVSQQPQYLQGLSTMPHNTMHLNTPYHMANSPRLFLPVMPNQGGWPGLQQQQTQPLANITRPPSSGFPNWADMNTPRPTEPEKKEQFNNYNPEFVRADAYYELQNHANNLQLRFSSLEQRMEMLEDKMKRDNKNNVKFQKRQEKKAKKKSKKASTKGLLG